MVLTSRFPYPIEKGDKLRIYHQLIDLARVFDILLISIVDQKPSQADQQVISDLGIQLRIYTIPTWYRLLSALWFWLNGKPAQVGYFFHPRIKSSIYRDIIHFQPDRIYCQLIRVGSYVKKLPFVKIIDFMDCFSSGMRRQSQYGPFWRRWFYRVEAKLVQRYERDLYNHFDESIIITQRDRDEMSILSKDLIHVIPNGIDTLHFQCTSLRKSPSYDLLFVGNLGYKPNEQAVMTLYSWYQDQQLAPITVAIAGARATRSIVHIEHSHWTLLGWQDDIRDAYCRAGIFVAPLVSGSGLQNKILEAMSCGLPCITTSMVNDSLGAIDREHLWIADSAGEMKNAVLTLKNDRSIYERMSNAARQFVVNHYQWSVFNQSLINIITDAQFKGNKRHGSI